MTITKSSVLSLLPYASTVAMTIFVGPIADKLVASGTMTRTNVRKMAQSIAFIGPSICLMTIGFIVNGLTGPASAQTIATVVGILMACFASGAWCRVGLFCCHQDLSPKYASTMLGYTNTWAAIASSMGTFATGSMLGMTNGSWFLSLCLPCSALMVFSTLLWVCTWNSEPINFDTRLA